MQFLGVLDIALSAAPAMILARQHSCIPASLRSPDSSFDVEAFAAANACPFELGARRGERPYTLVGLMF